MIKANNVVTISGGLTRDPEMAANDTLVQLSVAVDSAGREKDVKYAAGYFDVKFWLTDSVMSASAAVQDVKKGLAEGTLKKGTRVQIVGSLCQERWVNSEGKKDSRTVIMAESVSFYVAAGNSSNANNTNGQSAPVSNAKYSASEF